MTRSTHLVFTLLLVATRLLPLCSAVKMEDFKVGLWELALRCIAEYHSFVYIDTLITPCF